jgi:hypothetical protein
MTREGEIHDLVSAEGKNSDKCAVQWVHHFYKYSLHHIMIDDGSMFKEYLLYDAKCIFYSQRYNPWGSLISLNQKRKKVIQILRKVLKNE